MEENQLDQSIKNPLTEWEAEENREIVEMSIKNLQTQWKAEEENWRLYERISLLKNQESPPWN